MVGDAQQSGSQGEREAALYRLLFLLAGSLYVAWWPVLRFSHLVPIDPLWERCAVAVIALCGVRITLVQRLQQYAAATAEVVIYAVTAHYFTLVVRNHFSVPMLVGLFITLSAVGFVPRSLRATLVYSGLVSLMAFVACAVEGVGRTEWTLTVAGVVTVQLVGLSIALRLHGATRAQQEAERGLIKAKETAEHAARVKSEFLAKISHELRTPMNGVINMVRLAKDTRLTDEQHDYLQTANACAEGMLGIVNDLLDLSKLEAGRMVLHPVAFSLADLLDRGLRELRYRAAAKGVALRVSVNPDVPDRLRGDELRIRQVLVNLVGNAVKFTERGTIDVTVAAVPVGGARHRLSFWVIDTGPGIPAHRLEHVFKAFTQADGEVARRHGGTGLGLTVSAELVELMGGRLDVSSTVGQGSSFLVELTLERAAEAPALASSSPPEPVAARPLSVLVAEDNRVNAKIARTLLERAGHQVVTVEDGALALEALRARDFDVVLLDVQMPELDGLQVARLLRGGAIPARQSIPLIAVTAQAIAGDREKCLAAGMDDYLTKPIDRQSLLATIDGVVQGANRVLAPAPAAGPGSASDAPPAIDEQELTERLGGDPSLLVSVLEAYQQDGPRLLARIERAVAERAGTALARATHELKGSLLTLGAGPAARAAATLEQLAKGEWSPEEGGAAFARLKREHARVDAFISARLERAGVPVESLH